jgi:hypothetical protein
MLMTLKSELEHCLSYRDIIRHVFDAQQSGPKFWSEFSKIVQLSNSECSKITQLDDCDLIQQAAQQILNKKCDSKVKTLLELSMNQVINNIACSALTKIEPNFYEEAPKSNFSSVRLSEQENLFIHRLDF